MTDAEIVQALLAPIESFHIAPQGDAPFVIDGSDRFVHERDVKRLMVAAKAAAARLSPAEGGKDAELVRRWRETVSAIGEIIPETALAAANPLADRLEALSAREK